MMPSWDQTGVPGLLGLTHFHSSMTSGSACWMSLRIRPRVLPRQPPRSSIRFEMRSEADGPRLAFAFSMASILNAPGQRRRGQAHGAGRLRGDLEAAPEEVRGRPQHHRPRRPAPGLRTVAPGEVGDDRGAEVEGEAGVGPFL